MKGSPRSRPTTRRLPRGFTLFLKELHTISETALAGDPEKLDAIASRWARIQPLILRTYIQARIRLAHVLKLLRATAIETERYRRETGRGHDSPGARRSYSQRLRSVAGYAKNGVTQAAALRTTLELLESALYLPGGTHVLEATIDELKDSPEQRPRYWVWSDIPSWKVQLEEIAKRLRPLTSKAFLNWPVEKGPPGRKPRRVFDATRRELFEIFRPAGTRQAEALTAALLFAAGLQDTSSASPEPRLRRGVHKSR